MNEEQAQRIEQKLDRIIALLERLAPVVVPMPVQPRYPYVPVPTYPGYMPNTLPAYPPYPPYAITCTTGDSSAT